MSTLNKLIEQLQALQAAGKGDLPVYARHGASGACYPVGGAHISTEHDECGPFDVTGEYVAVYVGH